MTTDIQVALFDIDGTLTTTNVWRGLTASTKIPSSRIWEMYIRALPFWGLHKIGLFSQIRFRHLWAKRLASMLRGWTEAQIDDLSHWVVHLYLLQHYRDDVVAELKAHKANGAHIILVSNMFKQFVDKVAAYVDADVGLGTQLEMRDGVATGRIVGPPSAGQQKVDNVRAYLRERSIDIDLSQYAAAYADSHSDAVLLEAVKHPTATYPDEKLAIVAQEHGWRILQSDDEQGYIKFDTDS